MIEPDVPRNRKMIRMKQQQAMDLNLNKVQKKTKGDVERMLQGVTV